jgi:hypothetical protein
MTTASATRLAIPLRITCIGPQQAIRIDLQRVFVRTKIAVIIIFSNADTLFGFHALNIVEISNRRSDQSLGFGDIVVAIARYLRLRVDAWKHPCAGVEFCRMAARHSAFAADSGSIALSVCCSARTEASPAFDEPETSGSCAAQAGAATAVARPATMRMRLIEPRNASVRDCPGTAGETKVA